MKEPEVKCQWARRELEMSKWKQLSADNFKKFDYESEKWDTVTEAAEDNHSAAEFTIHQMLLKPS